jgi:hypothetical protein
MRTANALIAGLLASTVAAGSAFAADACVQKNRIFSTRVIDSSTMLITDMDKKQYTVHMRGACVGFNKNAENITFRPTTELGCLSAGDSVGYNQPGERVSIATRGSLQSTCTIDSVTAGAPAGTAG